MRDENIISAISHQSLPNPSKTKVLLLKLQVLSHAEHNSTVSTELL